MRGIKRVLFRTWVSSLMVEVYTIFSSFQFDKCTNCGITLISQIISTDFAPLYNNVRICVHQQKKKNTNNLLYAHNSSFCY